MVTAARQHATERTSTWLHELARDLERDDPDMVFHALSGGLQRLRDRIPLDAEALVARVAGAFPGDLSTDPEAVTRAAF